MIVGFGAIGALSLVFILTRRQVQQNIKLTNVLLITGFLSMV
jgi:hypothetical protein